MSENNPNDAPTPTAYARQLAPSLWHIGTRALETLGAVQRTDPLTPELLEMVVSRWADLRGLMPDLDWWVSDAPPAFEPVASSYLAALF